MACPHNQAQIDANNAKIAQLQEDISQLQANISQCNEQINYYSEYGENIDCVINNLEGNVIQAGQSYDQGTMTESKQMVEETIEDLSEIINQCSIKIEQCNTEIAALEQANASLQGDCAECSKPPEDDWLYGSRSW